MKKIGFLCRLMLTAALMTLIWLFADCREVYAGLEKIECVVHEIEICSICGHNYNDAELCSHQKGITYNSKECKPYEEKYCNICGQNMIYCEHVEGVEYGGTECKPWERCNICGNNYYDPNGACSHWEGNEYGGETCNTSVKRICNVCNDLYLNCLHIAGHEYENVVYYYYIEDRSEQAKIDALDLETIRDDIGNPYNYKNKISKVVKVPMNTNDEFKAAWNGIGKGEQQYYCIYALIMNMHGNAMEISNGPGKGYSMRLNMEDIRALERKPVQRLLLLQCNVGSTDCIGNNAASAFAEKVTGKVLAGDGEVHIHTIYESEVGEKKPNGFFSSEEGIYMQYEARKEGWSFYQYDRDRERVICTQTDKNWLRIYQLIDMF